MSDKNRIKRLRKIVVGGEIYKYLISKKDNEGYKDLYLTIWKNKKPIYSEIVQGEESVQPRIVEEKILNLLAR